MLCNVILATWIQWIVWDVNIRRRRPLYSGLPTTFEDLANVLASALEGNYSLVGPGYRTPPLQEACSIANDTTVGPGDAQQAILCGDADVADPDGPHRAGKRKGLTYWQNYISSLKSQSSIFGFWWSEIASQCSGWRIRPKWRFAGPFTTPPADPSLKDGVPAAPVLFTSSRLDPVTPLRNAYAMSDGHPGSAVLIHETVGHCAAFTGWSECFRDAVRAYFDDGIVPENGTACESQTCRPFSKDGDCLRPGEVVAAGVSLANVGTAADRRRRWSNRPLEVF